MSLQYAICLKSVAFKRKTEHSYHSNSSRPWWRCCRQLCWCRSNIEQTVAKHWI